MNPGLKSTENGPHISLPLMLLAQPFHRMITVIIAEPDEWAALMSKFISLVSCQKIALDWAVSARIGETLHVQIVVEINESPRYSFFFRVIIVKHCDEAFGRVESWWVS